MKAGYCPIRHVMRKITSASPIQGIIFDFGSTLSITRATWPAIMAEGGAAMGAWLRKEGLDLPGDFAELWAGMLRFSIQHAEQDGLERPAEDVLALLLTSQGCASPHPEFLRRATDCYFSVEDGWRAPATGAAALLAELKAAGYRVGILSNTIGGRWVQRWTDAHGFRPYVDTVITSDEIGLRKPRPEIFLATLARMGLSDPVRAVMVGDTLAHDIAGAQPLGMHTVLVSLDEDQGFAAGAQDKRRAVVARPSAPETVQADAQITDLAGLMPILESWQAHGF